MAAVGNWENRLPFPFLQTCSQKFDYRRAVVVSFLVNISQYFKFIFKIVYKSYELSTS